MKHRTRQAPQKSSVGMSYISGFLEGKFFLSQGIPVSKTLLWANNDFARGFRAGYFGDELTEAYRRKTVTTAAPQQRDRRRSKR
jgi:hypothetical protein